MLKKKFKIVGNLGTGTYSKVYKVKRLSDGKFYALKKVKMPNLSKKGDFFKVKISF
jgi:NIMA (never in mitosis gene a)-related kinase